jgi:hypothetical protein
LACCSHVLLVLKSLPDDQKLSPISRVYWQSWYQCNHTTKARSKCARVHTWVQAGSMPYIYLTPMNDLVEHKKKCAWQCTQKQAHPFPSLTFVYCVTHRHWHTFATDTFAHAHALDAQELEHAIVAAHIWS